MKIVIVDTTDDARVARPEGVFVMNEDRDSAVQPLAERLERIGYRVRVVSSDGGMNALRDFVAASETEHAAEAET